MRGLLVILSVLVVPLGAWSQTEQPAPSPSKPAESARLKYEEKSREAVKGVGELVSYAIWTEGLPTDKKYSVTVKWMNGKTGEAAKAIGIEPSGYALEVQLASTFPGERFELAVIAQDGSARASVEITPVPIHAEGSSGCRLFVQPLSLDGNGFQIMGDGFALGHDLRVSSTSSGERSGEKTVKGRTDGSLKFVIFPAVVGKSGGDATFTASDDSCSVTVAYRWGDQMRSSGQSAEARAALKQQLSRQGISVSDPQASGSVPATPKPASSDKAGDWSALEKRGRSLYTEGKLAEAEPLFVQSLGIVEKELGPNDLAVAFLSNDLGMLYTSVGRLSEAEPAFQRALAITEKKLGPNHPTVAILLTNYAGMLRRAHRTAQADQMEARAKKIRDGATR